MDIFLLSQVSTFNIPNDLSSQWCWYLLGLKKCMSKQQYTYNVKQWTKKKRRNLLDTTKAADGILSLQISTRTQCVRILYCNNGGCKITINKTNQSSYVGLLSLDGLTFCVCVEVSILTAFSCHSQNWTSTTHALLHVFALYLNSHDCSRNSFGSKFYINHGEERTGDWFSFYLDAREELPVDAPEPLGKGHANHMFH